MKKTIGAAVCCLAILFGVFLVIHRRVIAAWLTGGEMPEPPEWHKKCFGCACGNAER